MDYETPQFYRLIEYARAADRDVVDLVSGSPDWGPPAAFREGLREYADADQSAFDYGPSEGLRGLREGIAARHDVAVGRIVVTNGAGEANHLAMTCGLEQFSGDEIVLADPVYPYYAGRANLLDAATKFVTVDGANHLDPAAVRDVVSSNTSVIVVNSPNNPTGAVYDAEAMGEFVIIAAANDALLVSDEVYERFDYSGRFASALDVIGADVAVDDPGAERDDGASNVVVTNAVSKSMAITGARVGYGIFPPTNDADGSSGDSDDPPDDGSALLDRARTRHMLTNVAGSRPVQSAVSRALAETPDSYYAENRRRMVERIDRFCDALDAMGADCSRPEGAFYVLASLPGVDGTLDDAFELVDEAGVAAMPGEAFGRARADHLRFALLTPRVETAIERLRDHLDRP